MDNVFDVRDPLGRIVYCAKDCWNHHILVYHPFMRKRVKLVISTIEKPDCIRQDIGHKQRRNYYRLFGNKKLYVKVVVEFADRDVGDVRSAFLTDNWNKGEMIEWPMP